ncbi:MAG: VIT domain-containing protein [Deltaproteobacteria bacterium]|nr:VIT domain-containing protein [Deltaproteobacteria bacterium]
MKKLLSLIIVTAVFLSEPDCYAFKEISPVSLTASDGTGLDLKRFEARVVLDGFLAFTELEMVFHNPEDRRREGRFQIILPDNAAISRFAMRIGNDFQEGEVVERKRARQIYEDFLHRRQDPALLESDSGNRFNARIFPIEPKSDKTIILSYSQRLERQSIDYELPLKGLPKLDEFKVKVIYDRDSFGSNNKQSAISSPGGKMKTPNILNVEKFHYLPEDDFRMKSLLKGKEALAMRSGKLMAVSVIPYGRGDSKGFAKEEKIEDLVLLVDSSASQAPYFKGTVDYLKSITGKLNIERLHLYAFDQDSTFLGKKSGKKGLKKLLEKLDGMMPLGATNLEKAFKKLKEIKLERGRLVIVSDVVATAGERGAKRLKALIAEMKWLERVDIISPSAHRDDRLSRLLVKGGKRQGLSLRTGDETEGVAAKLAGRVYGDLPVNVSGAEWFWPEKIDSVLPGEPVIIFAALKESSGPVITINKRKVSYKEKKVHPILLNREWVRARIDRLLYSEEKAEDRDIKSAIHNRIIKLSIKERVLSRYTAMLVLETEMDYERYQIDRRALAHILTVGVDGITLIKRKGRVPVISRPSMPVEREKNKLLRKRETVEDGDIEAEAFEMTQAVPGGEGIEMKAFSDALPEADLARPAAPEPESESEPMMEPEPVIAEEIVMAEEAAPESIEDSRKEKKDPYTGKYADFRKRLDKGRVKKALEFAVAWRMSDYSDTTALLALGEAYEAASDFNNAVRAYGSLIDYYPGRADIRRWAAERLLSTGKGLSLAVDSLEKALKQRSDHPSGHYLLAMAYWAADRRPEAIEILLAAGNKRFDRRFPLSKRIISETLDLMMTYLVNSGEAANLLKGRSIDYNHVEEDELRFVLSWETDTNDVDFHIYDGNQNHAFYKMKKLKSGGELYADVTRGYGPECFRIKSPRAFPYSLKAHYYNMGPMGYGMGLLHILSFSPNEGIRSEFRPFFVMQNQSYLDMGLIRK